MTDEQLKAIEAVAEAGRTLDAARIACGQAAETVEAAHSNYDDAAAKADKSVPYGENPSLFILESGEAVCVAGSTYYIPAARVTDLRPAASCAACEEREAERTKFGSDFIAGERELLAVCEAKEAEIERLKDATPATPTVEALAEAIKDAIGGRKDYAFDRDGSLYRPDGESCGRECQLYAFDEQDIATLAHAALKRLPPLPSRRLTGEDILAVAEEVADKLGLAKPNPKPSDAFYVEVAERLNAVMFGPREIVEIPPDKRREALRPGMQVTLVWPNGPLYRYEVVRVTDRNWESNNDGVWALNTGHRLFHGWLTAEEVASVKGAKP